MINWKKHKNLTIMMFIGFLWVFILLSRRWYFDTTAYSIMKLQSKWLTNLTELQWPKLEFTAIPTKINETIPPLFDPKMSRGQRETIILLFSTFASLMDRLQLDDRWMLYGGTLMGSFRHHDFIPWDDDFDFLVDASLREILRAEFKLLEPNYFMVKAGDRDKVFAKKVIPSNTHQDVVGSRQTNPYNWRWPFLDLTYYTENATHITEIARFDERTYSYLKVDTFPLIWRPLGDRWAPAPINTLAFLQKTYPNSYDCVSPSYSHVLEKVVQEVTVSCGQLAHRYAFVRREPLRENFINYPHFIDWVIELLIIQDIEDEWKEIHRIKLLAPRSEAHRKTFQIAYPFPHSSTIGTIEDF